MIDWQLLARGALPDLGEHVAGGSTGLAGDSEATAWFRKAAEQGDLSAQASILSHERCRLITRFDILSSMRRLEHRWTDQLLKSPESGMGYQRVEATLRDNKTERGIAYNAELLFLGNEPQTLLLNQPYTTVLKSARSSDGEIVALRVLPRETTASRSAGIRGGAVTLKAAPARDALIEKTKPDEVFKRFSAYEKDNRRRSDGSWLAGTYATTEEDAKNIKTGKDAVSRYALPNPKPASYMFTGRPHKDTEIQKGTVAPTHHQPGGGVEVIFSEGTQPNTVTEPVKIPDE